MACVRWTQMFVSVCLSVCLSFYLTVCLSDYSSAFWNAASCPSPCCFASTCTHVVCECVYAYAPVCKYVFLARARTPAADSLALSLSHVHACAHISSDRVFNRTLLLSLSSSLALLFFRVRACALCFHTRPCI